MTDNSNRREFLQGRAAARALADFVHPPPAQRGGGESPLKSAASYLLQVGRQAMACRFEANLNAGQHQNGAEVAVEALDLVDELESQLTVYRPDSEVSQINTRAAGQAVRVELLLYGLLRRSLELSELTRGAFDITAGSLSKVWGFYRRQGKLPDRAELEQARRSVGWRYVELNPEKYTIRFLREGVEINLGGIGKGYALDRAAELMREQAVADFLFSGGQSSVLAFGSRLDGADGEPGWRVGIRNPLRPEQRLGEFLLQNQALGTSGSGTQFFHHRGKRYGHILDPRTGWPAEKSLTTSVIAPSAAEADALATACYVLGVEGAEELCRQRNDIGAVVIARGKRPGEVETTLHGLAKKHWREPTPVKSPATETESGG